MQECLINHPRCNRGVDQTIDTSSRPRRLLGLADGRVVLRLSENISKPLAYLTLSHTWGALPEAQLRLTLSCLEEMQNGISWHRVPNIYKMAIRLTLDLGYQYLWVDSLCIIQDSPADWEHEAAKMADIYRNGVCNVSFLFPPETGDDYLWSDPRVFSSCILREADFSIAGVFIRPVPHHEVLKSTYWKWLDSTEWPLFTRAWAFQEHFLYRRMILYGHHHLAWE